MYTLRTRQRILILATFVTTIVVYKYTKQCQNTIVTKQWKRTIASFSDFRWCHRKSSESSINLNCELLFSGDNDSIEEAKRWKSPCQYTDEMMMTLTRNCSSLKEEFPMWTEFYEVPNESVDYPLAFVIVGSKNSEAIVRLLQTIYSKRNVYCITYDNKSSEDLKETLRNLDSCYDNILMPDKFVNIYWGGFSILQTAMFCLKALVEKTAVPWRYAQILSWNDFPLRTNEEFVTITKIFNGAQDSFLAEQNWVRTRRYFNVTTHSTDLDVHLIPEKINQFKNIPPGHLIEYYGSFATTMTKEFVEFLFTNSIAQEFYHWVNSSFCPEEVYWSTLMHNLHINPPGGFPGSCVGTYKLQKQGVEYLSRYQTWEWEPYQCTGMFTSYSCVFGVGDLGLLQNLPHFIAHKIYLPFQPATYYCMAQMHFNKTFFPSKYSRLNVTFYENRTRVRYQRMKDKKNFNCF